MKMLPKIFLSLLFLSQTDARGNITIKDKYGRTLEKVEHKPSSKNKNDNDINDVKYIRKIRHTH